MRRGSRATAAVAAAMLAATACTSRADDVAPPTSAPPLTTEAPSTTTVPSTTTTTVALPPPVPIAWRGCGGGFECAEVTVPVDYADPAGPTLQLALVQRPAADSAQRIGTLVMNPGGPGASGVRRVRRGFTISPEVAARFDIVGFDPRGIGDSTPVTCGAAVPAFRAADLAPDSPEEAALLDSTARAVADECARTEGARLAHLGTREVVHDLEVIRRNLGEPQVSFVGLSYGTLIGLLWAEAYPSSVRALVLDGVVDPASGGDATAVAQLDALDRSLQDVDDACAADPGCPFTARGERLLAGFDALLARVEAGDRLGAGVGPTQLTYAAFAATYGAERWPRFWRAVQAGLDGDGSLVAAEADWFSSLVDYAPYALVTCLDSAHPMGFDAWQAEAARSARRSPRFGAAIANELLPCAYWPPPSRTPHVVRAPGTPPILVVGSTGDVATPYAQAEEVAANLASGVLLTVELDGHIAIGDSACADAAITRYLVDLTPPPAGTRC